MSTSHWQVVKSGALALSFIIGLGFGIYLILTSVLGGFTPFNGLKLTGIGVLWVPSMLWEYSLIGR